MLQDALHTSQRLNHVSAVVVQVPQLAIMLLMRPPEGIQSRDLELLELLPDTPTSVIGQRVTILLEQCVDARDPSVPAVI
jgi:hypothetical protein